MTKEELEKALIMRLQSIDDNSAILVDDRGGKTHIFRDHITSEIKRCYSALIKERKVLASALARRYISMKKLTGSNEKE